MPVSVNIQPWNRQANWTTDSAQAPRAANSVAKVVRSTGDQLQQRHQGLWRIVRDRQSLDRARRDCRPSLLASDREQQQTQLTPWPRDPRQRGQPGGGWESEDWGALSRRGSTCLLRPWSSAGLTVVHSLLHEGPQEDQEVVSDKKIATVDTIKNRRLCGWSPSRWRRRQRPSWSFKWFLAMATWWSYITLFDVHADVYNWRLGQDFPWMKAKLSE